MAKMRAEEAALASAKAEQQCNADADPATVDAGVSLDPSPGSSRSSVVQDRQILCLLKVMLCVATCCVGCGTSLLNFKWSLHQASTTVCHAVAYVLRARFYTGCSCNSSYGELTSLSIMLCLQVLDDSKLECEQVQELMMPADLSTLPDHAVVLKQQQVQPLQSNQYIVKVSPPTAQYSAVGATFGQSLLGDGTMCRHDSACHVTGTFAKLAPV